MAIPSAYERLLAGGQQPQAYQREQRPDYEDAQGNEPEGGFLNAVSRGVDQFQATLYSFADLMGEATGINWLERYGENGVRRQIEEIMANPAKVESWDDIDSLADIGTWAVERIGEQVPNIGFDLALYTGATLLAAPTGGASLAGAASAKGAQKLALATLGKRIKRMAVAAGQRNFAAGTVFASATVQGAGETQMELAAEGASAPLKALLTGTGKGLLDTISLTTILGAAKRIGTTPGSLVEIATHAAKEAGVASASEGLTEGVQTVLDKLAVASEVEGYDPFSRENWAEIVESAAAGALVGGTVSGTLGGVQAIQQANRDGRLDEIKAKARAQWDKFGPTVVRGEDGSTQINFGKVNAAQEEDNVIYAGPPPEDTPPAAPVTEKPTVDAAPGGQAQMPEPGTPEWISRVHKMLGDTFDQKLAAGEIPPHLVSGNRDAFIENSFLGVAKTHGVDVTGMQPPPPVGESVEAVKAAANARFDADKASGELERNGYSEADRERYVNAVVRRFQEDQGRRPTSEVNAIPLSWVDPEINDLVANDPVNLRTVPDAPQPITPVQGVVADTGLPNASANESRQEVNEGIEAGLASAINAVESAGAGATTHEKAPPEELLEPSTESPQVQMFRKALDERISDANSRGEGRLASTLAQAREQFNTLPPAQRDQQLAIYDSPEKVRGLLDKLVPPTRGEARRRGRDDLAIITQSTQSVVNDIEELAKSMGDQAALRDAGYEAEEVFDADALPSAQDEVLIRITDPEQQQRVEVQPELNPYPEGYVSYEEAQRVAQGQKKTPGVEYVVAPHRNGGGNYDVQSVYAPAELAAEQTVSRRGRPAVTETERFRYGLRAAAEKGPALRKVAPNATIQLRRPGAKLMSDTFSNMEITTMGMDIRNATGIAQYETEAEGRLAGFLTGLYAIEHMGYDISGAFIERNPRGRSRKSEGPSRPIRQLRPDLIIWAPESLKGGLSKNTMTVHQAMGPKSGRAQRAKAMEAMAQAEAYEYAAQEEYDAARREVDRLEREATAEAVRRRNEEIKYEERKARELSEKTGGEVKPAPVNKLKSFIDDDSPKMREARDALEAAKERLAKAQTISAKARGGLKRHSQATELVGDTQERQSQRDLQKELDIAVESGDKVAIETARAALDKARDKESLIDDPKVADSLATERNEKVKETWAQNVEDDVRHEGWVAEGAKKNNKTQRRVKKAIEDFKEPLRVYGKSITSRMTSFARGVLNDVGITAPLDIVEATESALKQYAKEGRFQFSEAEIADIIARFKSKDRPLNGLFKPKGAGGLIIIRPDGDEGKRLWVLGHEIGHFAFEQARSQVTPEQRARLEKAWKADVARLQKQGDTISNAWSKPGTGFEEWFADKIVARTVSLSTKPKSLADKIIRDIARKMKKVWDAIKGRLPKRFHANRTVNSVVEEWKNAEVFATPNVMETTWRGFTDEVYPDPPTIGDNYPRSKLAEMGRAIRDGFRSLADNKAARWLFTVDGQLRAINPELAKKIYQRTSETVDEKSFQGGVRATRDRWIGEIQKITRRYNEEERKRIFYDLATEAESAHPAVAKLRALLDSYYTSYLKKYVGNLGPMVENYFPRHYDTHKIKAEQARFKELLNQYHVENVDAVTNAITGEDLVYTQKTRETMVASWAMERKIRDPQLIKKLVDEGFLNPDPQAGLIRYIERTSRRAEYERLFGAQVRNENGDWEWDPNAKLDLMVNRAAGNNTELRNRMYYLVSRSIFNLPIDTESPLYNIIGEVRAYESLRVLLGSGLASIPEVAAVFARMKGTIGIGEFARSVADTVKNYEEAKQLTDAMGVTREQMSAAIMTEMFMHEGDTSRGVFRRMLPFMFKWNGNDAVVNYSRVLAAGLGARFIQMNAEKAAEGDTRAKRYLAELGIHDVEIVRRWDEAGGLSKLWRSDLEGQEAADAEIVQDAINRFVNESVLHPNQSERPTWAEHPIGSLVFHLKTFAYSYTKNILGGIYREMESRVAEGDSMSSAVVDAASFLAPAMFVFLVFGAISEELRQRIFSLGEKGSLDRANGSLTEYVGNIADRAGLTAIPFSDIFTGYGDVTERASYAAGPTANHLYDLLFGDKTAGSKALDSIPILSQMPTLRQEIRDELM